MPDVTTTATPTTQPAEDDWASRYTGLQRVLAKRDAELHTAQEAIDALKAEHEAALTELATHRQKAVDATEEENARAQFELLKERFEHTPKPIGNKPSRHGAAGWLDQPAPQPKRNPSQGFPVD